MASILLCSRRCSFICSFAFSWANWPMWTCRFRMDCVRSSCKACTEDLTIYKVGRICGWNGKSGWKLELSKAQGAKEGSPFAAL